MHRLIHYFTKAERILWALSVSAVVAVFVLFDRGNGLVLIASLIGVTSLLFNAKGNPVGQLLMIAFSALYGYISYTFCYFGEMVTYLGMTAPMAAVALVSWLKNPYRGNRAEVKVNQISRKEHALMWLLTALVTVLFYFIQAHLRTANLLPSTLSVTTSFLAVYLTFRRSPYFALGYAANGMILIVLWTLAALEDLSYVSVAVCFAVFLVNDLYGFLSWRKMEKRQAEA